MSSRLPLIAVSIVLLGGIVALEEYRIADLKRQIVKHQAHSREIVGKLNRQVGELEDAVQKRDQFETQMLQMRKRLEALTEKQVEADVKAAAHAAQVARNRKLAKMFSDPEAKKLMRAQQTLVVRMLYGDLAKEAGLDAKQLELLTEILAERQMDIAAAAIPTGDALTQTAEQHSARVVESSKRYEDQLKAMLGDAQFKKLQDYEASMGDRFMFQQLDSLFTAAGAPLEAAQKQKMLSVIQEERVKTPAQFNFTDITNPDAIAQLLKSQEEFQRRVMAGTREIFNPAQLAVLEKVQRQQVEVMKSQIKMAEEFLGLGK